MVSARKTVLITGCSAGGIGPGLAEVFHEKGYHVFATARTPSKIPKSLAEAPDVTVLTLDILSTESIQAAVERVTKENGGRLDVLVNNSGQGALGPGLDASIEEGKKLFDVNFWGPFSMIQAFAPLVIEAKGCIVNSTSISGVIPTAFGSIYNSSKAAMIAASETFRQELAPLGVRTLTLVTCAVKSKSMENFSSIRIAEGSYYTAVRDVIVNLGDGRLQDRATTPREFGSKVVREIEQGRTGKFWVGGDATYARWGFWLLPVTVLEKEIEKTMYPFSSKLAEAHRKRE